MAKSVKMPDLGTTVDSVTLVEWLVKPGDTVKRGDPLANVETDKAVAELESVANGEILELRVENGEVIDVGKVIAYIGGVAQGAFHEAVNMAAIWNLPVVFVVENNRYAASTHYFRNTKLEQLSDLGAAYGIPSATIDGNNVLDVHGASCAAVAHGPQ